MRVEHVTFDTECSGRILIPRSKADAARVGRIAHLSPDTTRRLQLWIADASLATGPLFRAPHTQRVADGPLATSSIRRLIKRATMRAGLDPAFTADLSRHSMRIGAAQDMMVAGFDAVAIMQAAGGSQRMWFWGISRTPRRGNCMSGGGSCWRALTVNAPSPDVGLNV